MISIAVVDDMNLFRTMFCEQLKKMDGVELWNDFDSGTAFTQALASTSSYPDIAFVDLRIPDMNGIDICKWMTSNEIPVKIIMLSQFDQQSYIKATAILGASSYLLKSISYGELHEAIQSVYHEGYYFNESYKPETLIKIVTKRSILPNKTISKPLTSRELEVTKLICQEHSYKVIAEQLGITISTVDELKTRAMKKVGAKKVTGLVIYAAHMGWV